MKFWYKIFVIIFITACSAKQPNSVEKFFMEKMSSDKVDLSVEFRYIGGIKDTVLKIEIIDSKTVKLNNPEQVARVSKNIADELFDGDRNGNLKYVEVVFAENNFFSRVKSTKLYESK